MDPSENRAPCSAVFAISATLAVTQADPQKLHQDGKPVADIVSQPTTDGTHVVFKHLANSWRIDKSKPLVWGKLTLRVAVPGTRTGMAITGKGTPVNVTANMQCTIVGGGPESGKRGMPP